MECKHQLRELRGREATEENVRQIEAKKVRMELIEEDWMVVDDTLDLLQEYSDHHCAVRTGGIGMAGVGDLECEEGAETEFEICGARLQRGRRLRMWS